MRRDLSDPMERNVSAAGAVEEVREGCLELAKAEGIMKQAEALAVNFAGNEPWEDDLFRTIPEYHLDPGYHCGRAGEDLRLSTGSPNPEVVRQAGHRPGRKPSDHRDAERTLEALRTLLGELHPTEESESPVPTDVVDADLPKRGNSGTPGTYVPHQLPPCSGKFFGRQTELGVMVSRLQRHRNLVVTGAFGMGKTALAYTALSGLFGRVRNHLAGQLFPDGIVFVHLPTFGSMGKDAVWAYIADSFGAGLPHALPAWDRAWEVCRERKCLIVLDGSEAAGWAWQDLLSVVGPKVSVLVTSRVSEVPPSGWDRIELREMEEPQAKRELFDDCFGSRTIPDWAREALLKRLGGHPLALRVAGQFLETAGQSAGPVIDALLGKCRDEDPRGGEPPDSMKHFFQRGARNLHAEAEGVLAKVFDTKLHRQHERTGSASDLEVSRASRVSDATEAVEEARVLRNKVSIFTDLVTPLVAAESPQVAAVAGGWVDAIHRCTGPDASAVLPYAAADFYGKAVALAQEGMIEDALDELYEGMHDLAARREYASIDRLMAGSTISKEFLSLNIGLLSSSHPFRKEVSEWKSLYQKLTTYLIDSGRDPKRILPVP
jgi:hypothetical protein